MDVGTSMSATMNSGSFCYSSNDAPLSPIRERTQKAIAQHRAWRQPDLRRSYVGISGSAASQRPHPIRATATNPSKDNNLSESIRTNAIPNISISHSGSSSIPFDAAAAIYEDIELSESRLIHDFDQSDSVQEHLQQIENLILSPSMRSNVSSTSDRSFGNNNINDEFVNNSYLENAQGNRLGIAANEIYDTNTTNEIDLIRRQQYVYESYRTIQQQSPLMLQPMDDGAASRQKAPQSIVFRDEESVGTGMSQQELIRKKARKNRRRRLNHKSKKPIMQLPTQLLLPPRISTPHRQAYCAIQKQQPSAVPVPSKQHRTSSKSKSIQYEQYDDDDPCELESSSTTAETANESGDTSPGSAPDISRPTNSDESLPLTQDPQQRRRKPPTLAVRGDDALLWIEPIDQRSIGEESFAASFRSYNQGRDPNGEDESKNTTDPSTNVVPPEKLDVPPMQSDFKGKVLTTAQVPRASVRFAKSDVGHEDDESSMPWDQKTDLNGVTMNTPLTVLDDIKEEIQTPESPTKPNSNPAVPKSILRKSRYTASRIRELNGKDNETLNSQRCRDMNEFQSEPRDLSPPRMPTSMLDLEELELSPIPLGLEYDNQSSVEDVVDLTMRPSTNAPIGHPAEKHIQKTMATFLAMRDGELAGHVRDQEIYPDPPLEIDIDDDETVLSAYVFIETVAAIVIQTAIRQFLAALHLDSLRQTRDSFEVAQRVLSIEESCIEESMNTSSRATSSIENEHNDYSYENLIDDDLERATQEMYELAAIQIQSVYRGFWVRDCLDVDHYCATVLQRMYRGLRCRKDYEYDIWRIILVQSWCRRNIAREHAANILAYAIVIQSAVRAYFVRKKYRLYCEKKLLIKHAAATSIQSRWRSFVCEAHFIRALVDVLIVQTVVRKWIARQKVAHVRRERMSAPIAMHKTTSMKSPDTGSAMADDPIQSSKLQIDGYIANTHVDSFKILRHTASSEALHPTPNGNIKSENSHSSSSEKPPLQSTHPSSITASHAFSAKIVNKKSMDVTIVNDSKWRTAAARCITPETKKMYTKSKVVAYPLSDDDGSSCTESYRIVRNSRHTMTEDQGSNAFEGMTEDAKQHVSADRLVSSEVALAGKKQGTTTNLLSMWKEKEKRNGLQHRKALV